MTGSALLERMPKRRQGCGTRSGCERTPVRPNALLVRFLFRQKHQLGSGGLRAAAGISGQPDADGDLAVPEGASPARVHQPFKTLGLADTAP
jgi:hypothetical protein